ncbi:hypothetical protein J537_0118 [Acinetobacter baumannii 1437282]|nr:hypothetical protein J537_0118 [Acinetobacter baumannii 1437282]
MPNIRQQHSHRVKTFRFYFRTANQRYKKPSKDWFDGLTGSQE